MDLSGEEYRFKSKNKHWVPTKVHYTIDTFIEVAKNDINEQLTKTKKSSYNNLSEKELEVLEQLKKRDDVTSADKGGTIVIQDVKLYIKEAERQIIPKIIDHYQMTQ